MTPAPLIWSGLKARSPSGNLYEVVRLSDGVWQTMKNGTAFAGWSPSMEWAKSVATHNKILCEDACTQDRVNQ